MSKIDELKQKNFLDAANMLFESLVDDEQSAHMPTEERLTSAIGLGTTVVVAAQGLVELVQAMQSIIRRKHHGFSLTESEEKMYERVLTDNLVETFTKTIGEVPVNKGEDDGVDDSVQAG